MINEFLKTYKDGFEVMLNPKEKDELIEYIKSLEQDNEKITTVIDNFLQYLRGNEEHWKESFSWDSLIYGQLADYLERRLKV